MGIIKRNFANNILSSGTFDATKLTGDIPAGNLSANAPAFDDNKIVNDLSTLGLRVHTQENLNASNTNSQFVDVFNDASGIDTTTDAQRNASEYVSPVAVTAESGGSLSTLTSFSAGNQFSVTNGQVIYTGGTSYNYGWYKDSVLSGNYWLRWKSYEYYTNNSANPPSGNDNPGCHMAINYNNAGSQDTNNSIWNRNDNNFYWLGYRGNVATNNVHHYMRGQTQQAYDSNVDGTTGSYYYFVRDTAGGGSLKLYKGDYSNPLNLLHTFSDYSGTQTDGFGGAIGFPSSESKTGNWGLFSGIEYKSNITNLAALTTNATGNFTGTTITAPSTVSSMGAVITYQDNAGTNALNTDIVLQLSADGGSNYTTATLTALPDFSSGIKMAKVNDLAIGTPGTQLKYKISFANQSSGSKEARIRGVSLNY